MIRPAGEVIRLIEIMMEIRKLLVGVKLNVPGKKYDEELEVKARDGGEESIRRQVLRICPNARFPNEIKHHRTILEGYGNGKTQLTKGETDGGNNKSGHAGAEKGV